MTATTRSPRRPLGSSPGAMILVSHPATIPTMIHARTLTSRTSLCFLPFRASDWAAMKRGEAQSVLRGTCPFFGLRCEGRPLAGLLVVQVPYIASFGHEVHRCAEGREVGRARNLRRRDPHERRREHHHAKDDDRELFHGCA